jgi:hypothetical protein
MFASKKNIENLELCYAKIEKLKDKFSLKDNQDIIAEVNKSLKNYLDREHLQTIIFGSTGTALSIAKSYGQILAEFSQQAEEVNNADFAKSFLTALNVLNNPILQSELSSTMYIFLLVKQQEAAENARLARIRERQNISVQCLTFVAYGIYIDIISSLVPMSPVRIPGMAITFALIGSIASQYTAGYRSQEELYSNLVEMGDRVLSNSGLRYCYQTIPSAVENLALTIARNIENRGNTPLNAPPTSHALPATREALKIKNC